MIMVLTSHIPDPVHRRQSIFRRLGVLERVLEELFCIGLPRVAGLCKKRLRMQFASSTGIFKYNNDGMKVIRHAGVDSRMIILDDQARQ